MCILRGISTKLLGMPTHPCWSSLTCFWSLSHADWSLLLSGIDCQLPFGVSRRQLTSLISFSQLSDSRYLPTSGRIEISSPNPLSGFTPKQTNGSSAWRTTYIVSRTDQSKSEIHPYCTDTGCHLDNLQKAITDGDG